LKIAYTILYETALPMILLNEEWLKHAGFEIGESLVVQIEKGRIILIPDRPR
jgi:antitoxin component of MazEF toxin-antitoxin module